MKNEHDCPFKRDEYNEALRESSEKAKYYLVSHNLSGANLSGANLSYANLSGANLKGADLSQSEGLLDPINFLEAYFDRNEEGYIVYKTFNSKYSAPDSWRIEPGEILIETCNPDRTCNCGCGINVAPYKLVEHYNTLNRDIWKLVIPYEWLAGVVVTFGTDGKIRCSRAKIICKVEGK